MKRFHVHLRVNNLQDSINFYNAMFGQEASLVKSDYAKWMLDNPRINFAISTGSSQPGIEHLGIQTDSREELQEVYANMEKAQGKVREEGETVCCYAKSEKSWIADPQGIEWEAFYTMGEATVYGEGKHARTAPEAMKSWAASEGNEVAVAEPMVALEMASTSCCSSDCCA